MADRKTFRGVTRNLSESGIQVELPELKKKTKVHLTFRLPVSETMIDVFGTVVWCLNRQHGINFQYSAGQSHDSILHFINERKAGDR